MLDKALKKTDVPHARRHRALTSQPGTPGTSCPLLWLQGRLAWERKQTWLLQALLQQLQA